MIDAANHIVSREGLGLPKTYHETMSLLLREGILPRDMASTLERMVKFRNRAVHLYDEIEPVEIWGILPRAGLGRQLGPRLTPRA